MLKIPRAVMFYLIDHHTGWYVSADMIEFVRLTTDRKKAIGFHHLADARETVKSFCLKEKARGRRASLKVRFEN